MAMAASQGLSAVALTDHDTVEGLAEARAAAADAGVRLVQGCELSCEVGSATMHLLVYFLTDRPGPLQDRLSGLQASRADRNRRIVRVLQDHGLDVTLDEILAEAGAGSVGRPHVAGVLLRKGYVSSVQEAFDVWLAKGRPAYLDRDRLLPAEAIALAHASGAVAVLAHPTSLGFEGDELEGFIAGLAADGLDGMECEYGRYSTRTAGLAAGDGRGARPGRDRRQRLPRPLQARHRARLGDGRPRRPGWLARRSGGPPPSAETPGAELNVS